MSAMKKLQSFEDLGKLLGVEPLPTAESGPVVAGYDGKPVKLSVRADSKRRKGKVVTLVSGFQSNPDDLERHCAVLKKRCGSGGRVLDNEIEIQGDHSAVVKQYFASLGYKL